MIFVSYCYRKMAFNIRVVITLLIVIIQSTESISQNKTRTELLPSVIRSYLGKTVLIRDYVAVTINHSQTLEIPNDLKLMLEEASQIQIDLKNLSNTKYSQDRKLIDEIVYTNTLCKAEMMEIIF